MLYVCACVSFDDSKCETCGWLVVVETRINKWKDDSEERGKEIAGSSGKWMKKKKNVEVVDVVEESEPVFISSEKKWKRERERESKFGQSKRSSPAI